MSVNVVSKRAYRPNPSLASLATTRSKANGNQATTSITNRVWMLIYSADDEAVPFERTCSHSDLFVKRWKRAPADATTATAGGNGVGEHLNAEPAAL